jgi:hypothetical protein
MILCHDGSSGSKTRSRTQVNPLPSSVCRYAHPATQIAENTDRRNRVVYRSGEAKIPIHPCLNVPRPGQEISLPFVAASVRYHEVVPQIDRIAGPWNEMIHMGCIHAPCDRSSAIEALTGLDFRQYGAEQSQISAFGAEEKPVQIAVPA